MSEPLSKRPWLSRRSIIRLIAFMAIIQIGILAYLWILLRPSRSQQIVIEATSTPTQLPVQSTQADIDPTPAPARGPKEIITGSAVAATDYARRALMFDEEQALDHLAHLASDDLGGRQPGTSGGQAAGEYIAANFATYGLQSAGINDTYYQTFTVPYGRITDLPVLTIIPPQGETLTRTYDYRIDYRALTGGYVGAGEGEGPVVWLNECLHDDYADLDMVGKIALCHYSRDPQIYRQAIEHQVGGLLLLDREGQVSISRRPGYRETSWVPQTIPTYLISETVASDLLAGSRYALDDLSLRFTPTPLSTTVRMAVTVEEQDDVEARNVLGVLPGSDPDHRDEIVVIGAHYDHLGREPDGAIMYGANDNASGVATLLEIARLWQAQGYRPARSVLFAAWDGEEQGLLGSRHYVHNPTYALTQTIAMLNLDMVGAGDALRIDGGGIMATQLQASTEAYGVTTTLTFDGGSDHIAFYEVGIPAANLIWWPDAFYHTPGDRIEAIEPDKLKAVGVLSSHTLSALAEGHIELERAVERFRASILAGDREVFLAGTDPSDPDLQASQLTWFDNLWSRELVQATVELDQMRIGNGEADVSLTVAYRWSDAARPTRSVSYDVRFVQRDDGWYFAGYELDSLSGDVVIVARFPDVPVGTSQLLSTTQEVYLSLAADLGFQPIVGTRFIYYSGDETMRAIAQPAMNQASHSIVSSGGLAEIAWGRPITPALVHLALNQMGLSPDEGDWLREGLILHYEDDSHTEYLPVLAAADVFTSLLEFPHLGGQPVMKANRLRAYAWSATEYLLDRYGPEGLRALCAAWGRTNDLGRSFREALGIPVDQFESAWRTERIAPLHADAEAIQATIAARVEAVLAGDEASFLETVNPADPVLRTEEHNWFTDFDLITDSLVSYAANGQITDWSPGSDETIALLTVYATVHSEPRSQASYAVRFVRDGGRWFYADVPWTEIASEHFLLKHQDHDTAWAGRVLALAEKAYAQVTADLNGTPPLPQEIKIYDDAEIFRASISPFPSARTDGWTEIGEAIKLPLGDGSEDALQQTIAHELVHQVLWAQGLEIDWLHEGIASFEVGRVIPFGNHWMAGRYLPIVQEAVRRYAEFPLYKMPAWEDVPDDQAELYCAQSWSLVSAISKHGGLPGLRQFVAHSISSDDTAANLHAALGVDAESFRDDWRDHIYAAHVPEELLLLAQRFDVQRALSHIETLSSSEFAGREAGTPGADLTAAYIVEQMATLGLEPHLQQFPISHTHLISVPTFTLLDNTGAVLHEFVLNDDFVERGGRGFVEGDLVWLPSDDLEGLHFGGAVVLREDVQDSAAYAAELQARGAGGLIIANDKGPEYLQTHHVRDSSSGEITIPIFEITDAAFDSLLVQLGMEYAELFTYPSPALPLGVRARQTLARLPVTTAHTANVLGLLPGSDPEVADEVLLIGAHYDHIGQSPDGLYFPGANQNASGIGALLEMVRVWESSGYRPARSVLLAAWGAEEIDSAGVAHYLAEPAVPLTQTVGVIALDSIAGGRGFKLLFHGTWEDDAPLVHRIDAAAHRLDRRAWRRPDTGEGWHQSFKQADIPALKLIWDRAEDDFYSLSDTADAIDLDRLATSGEILTLTAAWLAER